MKESKKVHTQELVIDELTTCENLHDFIVLRLCLIHVPLQLMYMQ